MWHLGLWLNPIPGAHYHVPERGMPRFSIEEETTCPETTKELRSCLKAINTMPGEIFTEILAKSETPLISRFSVVLAWHPEILDRLEPAAEDIQPHELNGWFREDFRAIHSSCMQFEQNVPPEDPRYFIIGLDTFGICAFQLLENRPTTADSKFPDCVWYIVDKLSRLDDYFIRTNGYFLRLDPTRTSIDTLMLWDTPALPDQFTIVNDGLTKPMRMRCIATEQCTGISVFCNGRKIYGIYAHKGKRSSAADIYERLCHYRKGPLMWVYFPLALNEGIRGVWIRRRHGPHNLLADVALMIRTTLDRCYIFGPCFNPQADDSTEICLSKGQVSHLIHEDPDDGDPILCFGQTLPNDVELDSPEILQHPPTFHNKWDLFHSRASLENVEQVCLFFDERRSDLDKCCLGILFTYSDGHKGALGQCRMGLSLTATIERPTGLHFAEVTFTDGKTGIIVRVSSGNVGNNLSHRRQWQSMRMTGIITWWFNSDTIIPCIEEEDI
ncbi:hypothetical protein V491_00901 [Pseudogymnoascus sp. VKM F-3775]|nr:hypothetical protein V491_00901 [Pseudogymnoascus sp. VKM F-3775]